MSRPNQETWVVAVSLLKATDLPIADPALMGGSCDPYVTFTCSEQSKSSSCLPATLNPEWHEETFQFRVPASRLNEPLLAKVWDSDVVSADDLLGTVTIPLANLARGRQSEVNATAHPIELEAAFRKQKVNPILHLTVEIWSEAQASEKIRHEVWENERYNLLRRTWDHAHLEANDRKHWSSDNGQSSSDSFEAITPTVPQGYKPVGSWHYVKAIGDDNGWVYSKSFNGPWYKAGGMRMVVRRRRWINFFEKEKEMAPNEF
ncbi:Aste57867_23419 [Aphanomyces stellatus]|uniref:Aste57867_23419 protein n=1 Tax=Aphanomyces stellatus TaxID=120398 RepID=A0A485LN16_9STRA|nr:hypothetical protein As57867_023348 [Aphanomyces stellatus]VFU00065.1 Aste57867_23419 [Aphanomyces stellatus]